MYVYFMMKGNAIIALLIALGTTLMYAIYKNSDMFQLKCQVSTVDNRSYCVRDRESTVESIDLLARNTVKMQNLVDILKQKQNPSPAVKRLIEGFNPNKIVETLPTSEHTAYSENKGEKIAFCLEKNKGKSQLIDTNTLYFVSLHEMAHIATESVGHTEEFWSNFKMLLKEAVDAGLYDPVDYSKNPEPYCGMTLSDSPLFS